MNRGGTRLAHGWMATAAWLVFAAAAHAAGAADGIGAVTTPGSGSFTMCRNWLVTSSCTTYGRVELPQRIAIGDQLNLTYGSNPKHYVFEVVRLRRQGDRCTILSPASGPNEEGEKIEVAQCQAAATGN